jgi:DNA-binding response OmpR family regulator
MPRILVIEDEELMLKTLGFRLKKDGYEVLSAMDGKQGLEILETTEVDMVITDIMLPFVSGLEIVSKIKSNPETKDLPVIILSGVGLEKIVLEAFELGADDFITKPFNLSELSVRVRKLGKAKVA